MSSLVSGYQYDIFISYRQKDNKYDGWVTQFAENLKSELEATFKDEVSVYFDINSHDGLSDTHNVDASLKEKIKCLVFIPVISQTYCDPKSFAWQNEFVAFNNFAKEDRFGRDIILQTGNVASRILPVKIHDLDLEDRKLFEDETGNSLRAIDFIYNSIGVNRPLRANEDHPNDNLNKKYYRDQINKVANSIREIILTILHHNPRYEETSEEAVIPGPKKNLFLISIAVIVTVLSIFLIAHFTSPGLGEISGEVKKSIAVLPFTNISNDPEQSYFSDGLTSGILNSLAQLKDLKIIARTSSLQFRNKDPREAGKKLNVSTVLEGSIQRQGDNFRITAWLTDTKNGLQIWSQQYNESAENLFAVQDKIANSIAERLKITFLENQIETRKPTDNKEAYELYLKGRYFWNQGTVNSIDKGIDLFLEAISLDPRFAAAYSGLADCYTTLGYASILSPKDAIVKAKAAAAKAMEIDSAIAEVHASIGFFTFYYDWNWQAAENEFEVSILLNPHNELAYSWYSYFLTAMGKYDQARTVIEKARDLDPLSFKIMTDMGFILYYSGNYEMAIKELQSSFELNHEYGLTHFWLARCYQELKMWDKSIEEYRETLKIFPDWPVALAGMGNVYGEEGQKTEAMKMLDTLNTLSTSQYVTSYGIALVYAGLGEKDKLFEYLDKAYAERSNWLVWLKSDPRFESVRSDERYSELVKKVGLSGK